MKKSTHRRIPTKKIIIMDGVGRPPVKAAPPPPPPYDARILVKALDGITKWSIIFSFAAFYGLILSPSARCDTACAAGSQAAKSIVIFYGLSSFSFLICALVAHFLNVFILLAPVGDGGGTLINKTAVRAGIIVLESGTYSAWTFMALALVSTVARTLIKLGKISDDSLITHFFAVVDAHIC
ncbi:hypothetical protein QJS10_CPB14g00748 [Acorus calamus]|uniref:CASP-like protein n=1 Tax=Acorus calamus TaxID=4465 RepID=A0AAV9DD24_ACOCL|nr:hypothetical protein QJS10_CPB14g00748 [Acorus calamus]